jgi:hypothetical protein
MVTKSWHKIYTIEKTPAQSQKAQQTDYCFPPFEAEVIDMLAHPVKMQSMCEAEFHVCTAPAGSTILEIRNKAVLTGLGFSEPLFAHDDESPIGQTPCYQEDSS